MSFSKITSYIMFLVSFVMISSAYFAYKIHVEKQELIDENQLLRRELQEYSDYIDSERAKKRKNAEKLLSQKMIFDQSVNCLAYNIYYEAAAEPYEGMAAVAQVTINRTHESFRPKTICGVVYEPAQFSWTKEPLKKVNPSLFRKTIDIAKRFLTKKESSSIIGKDVTYFHRADIHPSWADQHEFVAQIGNHMFYKKELMANVIQ